MVLMQQIIDQDLQLNVPAANRNIDQSSTVPHTSPTQHEDIEDIQHHADMHSADVYDYEKVE